MQKAAATALGGALMGGLTNASDHPVAGTIGGALGGEAGGAIGGIGGLLLAAKAPKLAKLFEQHPIAYTMASQTAGAIPGSYTGGKLMAGLSSLLGMGNEKDVKAKVEDLVDTAKDRLQEEADNAGITDAINDARDKLGI